MKVSNSNSVHDYDRRLELIVSSMVPPSDILPGSDEVDLVKGIHHVLEVRGDLVGPFNTAIANINLERSDWIASLKANTPDEYRTISYVVGAAYVMTWEFRKRAGFLGLAPGKRPPLEGEAEYYLDDDILKSVTDRGAFYRSV